jgi:hypothetical protein
MNIKAIPPKQIKTNRLLIILLSQAPKPTVVPEGATGVAIPVTIVPAGTYVPGKDAEGGNLKVGSGLMQWAVGVETGHRLIGARPALGDVITWLFRLHAGGQVEGDCQVSVPRNVLGAKIARREEAAGIGAVLAVGVQGPTDVLHR